jgi:hypothetical protein
MKSSRLDAVLRSKIKCPSMFFGDFLASYCQIMASPDKRGSPQGI